MKKPCGGCPNKKCSNCPVKKKEQSENEQK